METARRVLQADPVRWALDNAPEDDEEETDEEQAAVDRAHADLDENSVAIDPCA